MVRYVFRLESDLLDEKLRTVIIHQEVRVVLPDMILHSGKFPLPANEEYKNLSECPDLLT